MARHRKPDHGECRTRMNPATGEVVCLDYHCVHCGERVNLSSFAHHCPHCDRPLPKTPPPDGASCEA